MNVPPSSGALLVVADFMVITAHYDSWRRGREAMGDFGPSSKWVSLIQRESLAEWFRDEAQRRGAYPGRA